MNRPDTYLLEEIKKLKKRIEELEYINLVLEKRISDHEKVCVGVWTNVGWPEEK